MVSLTELITTADEAFSTDSFCSPPKLELVSGTAEQVFLSLDTEGEKLTVQPDLKQEARAYSGAYLKFSSVAFPQLSKVIPIRVVIDPCAVEEYSFDSTLLRVEYSLGADELQVTVPSLVSTPDCGNIPEATFTINSESLPESVER